MATVSIETAQARLGELIDGLTPGEELIVTRDDHPIARLERTPLSRWPCRAGSAKGKILWIAPDFNAPLEELIGTRVE